MRDGLATRRLFVVDVMASPFRGADGNVEFLVHGDARGPALDDAALDAVAVERRHERARAVGLVPHPDRETARRAGAPRARRGLAEHGIDVRCPTDAHRGDSTPTGLDLVISLGGDGTMLRTVDLVYEAGVPVLGVNVGQLGYLTEVEPDDLDAALDRLLAGDYEVAERMVLEVTVESAGSAQGGGSR